MNGVAEVKAVVAQLAAARRNLVNVRADGVLAMAKGVHTESHANRLAAAERDLEFLLDCFLVTWGAWVEGVETGATPACGVEFNSFGHRCARDRGHAGPHQTGDAPKKDSYTAWVDGETA